MANRQLHCYCDHCANNTCLTNQLCYAEWKLVMTPPLDVGAGAANNNSSGSSNGASSNRLIQSSTTTATSLLTTFSSQPPPPSTVPSNSSGAANSPLLSTTTSSSSSLISQQASQLSTSLANLRLEKTYNCFKKDDPLLIRTICSETATNTSHVIRRCCHSGDYCNKAEGLLPSEAEALEEIRKYLPATDLSQQQKQEAGDSSNLLAEFYQQYSTLPSGLQILLILISVALVGYLIAMAQGRAGQTGSSSRRRRVRAQQSQQPRSRASTSPSSNTFKRILNNVLYRLGSRNSIRHYADEHAQNEGQGRRQSASTPRGSNSDEVRFASRPRSQWTGMAPPSEPSQPAMRQEQQRMSVEDFSFSSGRAESERARDIYDTNSMASREPLIALSSTRQHQGDSAPLNQQQPGPFMAEEFNNGRPPTAFQMSLGSANAADPQHHSYEGSSGSGSGQPYLTQRSIAHDIELDSVIGRGFFGVVWKGNYKGEQVAVKIFSPMAEPSWERECHIYQTTMLRHKNILGLIATDKRHDAALTGFWLVTDYYQLGSLYDFLHYNFVTMPDAIRMAFSIANGLAHLHIEILGTRGKPAIAHRDIKTKNILVKNDGTCCVADLGMAVRFSSRTEVVDVPMNTRIGTRRYLAPEVLDNKLNVMDFEAVKATDIYALGLVFWELMRRTCLGPTPESGPDGVALMPTYATNMLLLPSPSRESPQHAVLDVEPEQTSDPGLDGSPGSGRVSPPEAGRVAPQPQEVSSASFESFVTDSSGSISPPPPSMSPIHGQPIAGPSHSGVLHHLPQVQPLAQREPPRPPAPTQEQQARFQATQQAPSASAPQPGHQRPPNQKQQQLLQQKPPRPPLRLPHQFMSPNRPPMPRMPYPYPQPPVDYLSGLQLQQGQRADPPPAYKLPTLEQQQALPELFRQTTRPDICVHPFAEGNQEYQMPPNSWNHSLTMNESIDTSWEDPKKDITLLVEEYEAPYAPFTPPDPSAEEMKEIVCDSKLRPNLSPRWARFASMREMTNVMTECWYEKPQARLTSLRVRKTLGDLARKYFNMSADVD